MNRVYELTRHGFRRFLQRIDRSVDSEYEVLDVLNDVIEKGELLDIAGEHDGQSIFYSDEHDISVVVDERIAITVLDGKWSA